MLPDAPAHVPAALREAITAALPDLASATMSVAGRGWHSLAIDIDGRFIAKFPQGLEARDALLREARLLCAVCPHLSLRVPRMTIHEAGLLFSLHGKIPGAILLAAEYHRLAAPARDRLAAKLARFFAELHTLDTDAMREAGASPVEVWDTSDATLARVWGTLPASIAQEARQALRDYRDMSGKKSDHVYGFFDGHGWNMAFDHECAELNGIYDFADSGFGPRSREFVPVSLIAPDLARRTIDAYSTLTGRAIDRREVFLLTAAMRLSEYAGALETGSHADELRGLVVDWFEQDDLR